jgi:hypothetical protein
MMRYPRVRAKILQFTQMCSENLKLEDQFECLF